MITLPGGGVPPRYGCATSGMPCPQRHVARCPRGLNGVMLRGLRLRVPSLDSVIVQETVIQGLKDLPLLQEAAVLHRLAGHPRSKNRSPIGLYMRRRR